MAVETPPLVSTNRATPQHPGACRNDQNELPHGHLPTSCSGARLPFIAVDVQDTVGEGLDENSHVKVIVDG